MVNDHIKSLIQEANDGGYVSVFEILKWNMMKQYEATPQDLALLQQYAENF